MLGHNQKAGQRLNAQGFYWRMVTWAAHAWHVSKFQTPRRKAQMACVYQQFRYNEAFLLVILFTLLESVSQCQALASLKNGPSPG